MTDEEAKQLLREVFEGLEIQEVIREDRDEGVYVLLDAQGAPIYVGQSCNLASRLTQHADKPWVSAKVLRIPAGKAARTQTESALIHLLRPVWNEDRRGRLVYSSVGADFLDADPEYCWRLARGETYSGVAVLHPLPLGVSDKSGYSSRSAVLRQGRPLPNAPTFFDSEGTPLTVMSRELTQEMLGEVVERMTDVTHVDSMVYFYLHEREAWCGLWRNDEIRYRGELYDVFWIDVHPDMSAEFELHSHSAYKYGGADREDEGVLYLDIRNFEQGIARPSDDKYDKYNPREFVRTREK